MGASGILHEVDVLAIRKGTVLVCECKTGKVSRNDVFNFCTKASDLKAHISILALVDELPEPQTREFLKKNPAIIRIENMGKKKEIEVLNDLRQRLLIKG
jgi:Holliday junction resolvase